MPADIATFTNLGLAGFSIWIMWKMYDSSTKERAAYSARMKEKDSELSAEIDKRDARNSEQQKIFTDYTIKVHNEGMERISENTKALDINTTATNDMIKVMKMVKDTLGQAHTTPVIIQNNNGEAPK